MSRPFSYNDENFTVIGNVLFVHIIDNKARESNEPVVEIPPAIFERIKTSTNTCLVSYNDFINQKSADISEGVQFTNIFTIKNYENKNYFTF